MTPRGRGDRKIRGTLDSVRFDGGSNLLSVTSVPSGPMGIHAESKPLVALNSPSDTLVQAIMSDGSPTCSPGVALHRMMDQQLDLQLRPELSSNVGKTPTRMIQ
jgi:hypothetical protein